MRDKLDINGDGFLDAAELKGLATVPADDRIRLCRTNGLHQLDDQRRITNTLKPEGYLLRTDDKRRNLQWRFSFAHPAGFEPGLRCNCSSLQHFAGFF